TRLVPLVYRNTRFLTISESTRREMEELHMSRRPIEIVVSGVPRELVPGAKAAEPTILYLGRLKAYKRIRELIDAFAAIRARIPNARLVIAGEGDDRASLEAYASQRGGDAIAFTGRVDDATKLRLMQEAWVFGMPSSIEGWGIVVVEANACGTPAVAYDVQGLRDCIVDGRTGFLARDPAEFAERLEAVLADDALRERLSREARAWAEQFSWDKTAGVTLEQIRRLQPWRAVFEPDEEGSWQLRKTQQLGA
ncbi:MAG: glycosyltransferase family 4 protein, partial [Candidatus Eremiobacteraeota bacterium]|nr:glycosyltransferase family 4 protein [Candidatus Eremiobacteraeota bacterium]